MEDKKSPETVGRTGVGGARQEEGHRQGFGVDDLQRETLLRGGVEDGVDGDVHEARAESESEGSENSESSEDSGPASDSEQATTAIHITSTIPRPRLATDSRGLLAPKHGRPLGGGVGGDEELKHLPPADAQSIEVINRLLKATRLRSKYERRILRLMSSLKVDGNMVVKHMDLPTAFARFRDHHGRRGLNYTALLAYFSGSHAGELSVASKARLVESACCSKRRRQRSSRELFILRVFESCTPAELSELKLRLQSSIINLSRILDQYVKDRHLRDHLYMTIAEKAKQYLEQTDEPPQLHVLSDIDDTFVHSGIGLGGPKYPNKTVLPGVLALLHALDARVAFVTARPVFVERYTFRALQKLGISASVLCGHLSDSLLIPFVPDFCNTRISSTKVRNVVRYSALFPECRFVWFGDSGQGDVLTALELLQTSQHRQEAAGNDEADDAGKGMVRKDGEDDDDDDDDDDRGDEGSKVADKSIEAGGQGNTRTQDSNSSSNKDHRGSKEDAEVTDADIKKPSRRRFKRKCSRAFSGRLVAAYIQDVVLDDGLTFKTPAQERTRLAAHGVHVVDNYIEVALHMHQEHDLLTVEQLRDVTMGAVADVKAVAGKSQRAAVKQARFSEHQAKVMEVNRVLWAQGLPGVCFDETVPTSGAHRKQLETIVQGLSLAASA